MKKRLKTEGNEKMLKFKNKNEKKIGVGIWLIGILILVIGLSILTSNLSTKEGYDSNGFKITNVKTYLNLLKNTDKTYIYIGSRTCSHCIATIPVIKQLMLELDITINYVDIADMSQTDINKIVKSDATFTDGLGTPTILIVEDGKVVDSNIGEADYTTLKGFFLGETKFNEITVSQYMDIFNSNVKSYIYIGRTGCGYCAKLNPILTQIIDETGIIINHIDLANVSQTDYDTLVNSNDVLKGDWGTPTLLIVKNGQVIDSHIGYAAYDVINKFLLEQ
jgi:predicted bacteriocin transport accessory protein